MRPFFSLSRITYSRLLLLSGKEDAKGLSKSEGGGGGRSQSTSVSAYDVKVVEVVQSSADFDRFLL